MTHPLDRPIWDSLQTGHSKFAIGDAAAMRFQNNVSPFAGGKDESDESLAALAALIPQNGQVMVIQKAPIACPQGCRIAQLFEGVQMEFVNFRRMPQTQTNITPLSEPDAPQMQGLAQLTKPGPFLERTHALGHFWGVKQNGALVAMAGERLKHQEYVEVSAVCTHPDAQGQGLAHLLSIAVTQAILDRGKRPYLQAFATNTAAIKLYESLGYRVRTALDVAVIVKDDPEMKS